MKFNSESGFYIGKVFHSRFFPKKHSFNYDLFMVWLDLDKVKRFFDSPFLLWDRQPSLIAFDRRKYFPSHGEDLKAAVASEIKQGCGKDYSGKVFLLSHLSYFGFGFNPVSFYYCFNSEMTKLEYILAEITNTPWDERHTYVLPVDDHEEINHSFSFDKLFHVSPFFDMNHKYHWNFSDPQPGKINIRMENQEGENIVFKAGLRLAKFHPWSSLAFFKLILRYPLLTSKVLLAIYYQALKLLIKGVPFFSHPEKRRPGGK